MRRLLLLASLLLAGCDSDLPVGPVFCGAADSMVTPNGTVIVTQMCMWPGR